MRGSGPRRAQSRPWPVGGHKPAAAWRRPLLAAAVACAAVLLGGCGTLLPGNSGQSSRSATTSSVAQLEKVEVRQYKGKNLSSIGEIRNNAIRGPQYIDPKTYRLKVTGLVKKPLSLTYTEVKALPRYRKIVSLNCVEGWSVDILWQGVLVKDILTKAQYDPRASVVIFKCADGYSSSLPLTYIVDRKILLADSMNNVEIPNVAGFPFQVVAEDKWGYKWAKWVTEIEVSNDTAFRGYWESRGYSNDGTVGN